MKNNRGKLKNIEVEIKLPLLNSKALVNKLNKIAKLKKKGEYQKDTYFVPAHRNFLEIDPVSEWLRLRETKKGVSINYKNWHDTKKVKNIHCDEYETQVEDGEALEKILTALDFKQIVVVEKMRSTWDYKGTEIAVDRVTGLGDFMELEAKGDFQNVDEAKNHLYKVLSELEAKVGEQDFVGYPYLLLEKLQKL